MELHRKNFGEVCPESLRAAHCCDEHGRFLWSGIAPRKTVSWCESKRTQIQDGGRRQLGDATGTGKADSNWLRAAGDSILMVWPCPSQELSLPFSGGSRLRVFLRVVRPGRAQALFDRESGSGDGIAALLA